MTPSPGEEAVGSYKFEDMRISLVWRGACFESEAKAKEWHQLVKTFDYEEVLKVFEDDLRKKGVLAPDQPRPPLVDYANMVTNTYVIYPKSPKAWIAFNYCLMPDLISNQFMAKALRWLLTPLC